LINHPHVGQRVWADGLTGTFTVLLVDNDRGVADLQLTTDAEQSHAIISLSTLHPVGEDTTQSLVRRIKDR
jgi:hypothetical protein